jgi:8-oxo-dGTP pyrophosphatase MutT (NUDIX family)
VAFRHGPAGIEVVLVGRSEPERWVLPKGTPNRGESLDQTAVREVAEETGIQVRLIRPLHDIQYWFVLHGVRHYKTVHFYLMEAVGGDTSLHDHEYDEAAWFPIDEAQRRLSFTNERNVVTLAASALAELGLLSNVTRLPEAHDTSAAS